MTPPTDPRSPGHGHAAYDDGVHHEPVDGPLHNEDVAHEHSDINVRGIVVFLVILTVVTVLAAVAMRGLFVLLERQAAKNDPQLSPLAVPAGQTPPEPVLLTNEPAALEKHRAQERKRLESYGWVDQNAGVAHLPIEEAKKLLLQRGLPARAGEPLDAKFGTRAAAMADASSGRAAVVQGPAAAQPPAGPPQPGAQPGHAPAETTKKSGGH